MRKSDGQSVRCVVPAETTIEKDLFYYLDGVIGMAYQKVETGVGETSEVVLEVELAEYETSQIDVADAFGKGDDVYFDPATGLFNSVAAGAAAPADTQRFGVVTLAKDGNNVVWIKRTNLD